MTKITLTSHYFFSKNVIILSLYAQYLGPHNVSRKYINHYSGLSILMHDVISLPDVTSCDKIH